MKIRFNSSKEQQPTQELGLKVLYAPGKRLAFKLRWYLILLAVTSPLLWLLGRAVLSMWLIEAPAQLLLPSTELRAREPAQVQSLLVKAGDRVIPGQLLMQLDNPEWRERLALLAEPNAASVAVTAQQAQLHEHEQATLRRLQDSAARRLSQAQALLALGAATQGEVQAAADELARRQLAVLQFDRLLTAPQAEDRGVAQRQLERQWLQARLQGLVVRADDAGVVSEVLVGEGENVGPGTLLMRVQHNDKMLLWVFLDPRHIEYAVPGQALRLGLPDGSWLAAEVVRQVEESAAIPDELRPAFASTGRSLRVLARLNEPLAERWKVNRLGLVARFKHRWGWLGESW